MSESLRDICNQFRIFQKSTSRKYESTSEFKKNSSFLEQIFLLMLLLILALRNEVLPLGRRNGGLKTSHRLVTGRLRLDRSNCLEFIPYCSNPKVATCLGQLAPEPPVVRSSSHRQERRQSRSMYEYPVRSNSFRHIIIYRLVQLLKLLEVPGVRKTERKQWW